MPSIVGNLKIISIGSGSIVNIGDSIVLSPKSESKTFAGAGSFNTGDLPSTFNGISTTTTSDNDVVDQQTNSAI